MTDPIDFLIDTAEGQRSITIEPINITPTSGIQYATGQYDLKEGEVGIGTITFGLDMKDWTFDGITEIAQDDINQIARFIKRLENRPEDMPEKSEEEMQPVALPAQPQEQTKSLTIIVEDNGKPVDVRIEMNYPFYDVSVEGKTKAQIEQDHHSNWFVTKGQLNDDMVQEIGRRITQYISAA